MDLNDITEKLTSGDVPAGAMIGGAIVVLLLALKSAKGLFKVTFTLLAIALMAGAVWWHLKHRT
jgi:uncharacterized membrane protein YebE (DUF533 family)